jgi:hypothetical protein
MDRDYITDMRAILDSEAAGGDPRPLVAERIVEKLRATDPDLLTGWLDLNATQIVCGAIADIDRSVRSHARTANSRSAFAGAAERHLADPDGGHLGMWLGVTYTLADGHRPRLAEMSAADVLYVAEQYEVTSSKALMEAAFMRAVAKRVPKGKTVGDVFTDTKLASLRGTVVGQAA